MLPVAQRNNEIVGEAAWKTPRFSLSSISGFPEEEFHARRIVYNELLSWYTGDKLNAKQVQGGKNVEKYPIKINPVRGAVFKHAYALFGEFSEDSRPLAPANLHPENMEKQSIAQRGQNFINQVWADSHGRSVMMRNAILSQILGGCVFKVSYVPKSVTSMMERRYPFKVSGIYPSNFVGTPVSGDEYRLEEAWIVRAMSPVEARRRYNMTFPSDDLVYYIEYWNPDEIDFSVNGMRITSGVKDSLGQEILYGGKNPWKAIPIVYIPHIRSNEFYGESLVSQNVQAIVLEINRRMADLGDAVSDDSHIYYTLSGSSQWPQVKEVAPGLRVLMLKSEPTVSGKEILPEMKQLGEAKASESMSRLVTQLYEQFRREAFIPAVADGEDEGSQRSALTLVMRMWPLLSHTSMERVIWGDALARLDHILLRMAIEKGEGDLPKSVLDMRIERKWAPFLPKDREAFINELVNRSSANLGSIEHLLSLLDDIEDPAGEYKKIISQVKQLADIEADAAAEAAAAAYSARAEMQTDNNNSQPTSSKSNTSNSKTKEKSNAKNS